MKLFCLLGVLFISAVDATSGFAAFVDPIDTPAVASRLATRSVLTAVTKTPGRRWVAVGRRGHILLSEDGKNWRQVPSVPVSIDLVSVFFISATHGWAVGHGGVIIATTDGGEHWVKQFDGRQAAQALVKFYAPLAANSENNETAFLLQDATRFKESGPGRPFLDVWFSDEMRGYAVGAYNLLFVTEDGGNTWQPRPDLIDNEKGLHLSTIASVDNDLYVAGEQGLLARLNMKTGKFDHIKTPYPGSFFGLIGKKGLLVLFGLQGNAFRSRDRGASWKKIEPGLKGTITSGTILADGRIVLSSQAGALALSPDDGDRFTQVRPSTPTPIYAIAAIDGDGIVAVGKLGIKAESLKQDRQHGGR